MKILRFWGIPIHKVYSDEEIIEGVRKNLKRSKKLAWFHIAMLILLALVFPMLWNTAMFTIKQIPDEHKQMGWIGLMIGISTGIMIAQYVMIAGYCILTTLLSSDFLNLNRSSKLLIKYHDMLKENGLLGEYDEQQDGQIFAEENNDIRSSWNA
jgi:hypothetical protein